MLYPQAVQRSLEKLASKGTISEKINGKQRVYAPKQVILHPLFQCSEQQGIN